MGKASVTGTNWKIEISPSIFTSRRGKKDIVISRQHGAHGAMDSDGKWYAIAMIVCADTMAIIRHYEHLLTGITLPLIHQWILEGKIS
jgi:hypothetical protein